MFTIGHPVTSDCRFPRHDVRAPTASPRFSAASAARPQAGRSLRPRPPWCPGPPQTRRPRVIRSVLALRCGNQTSDSSSRRGAARDQDPQLLKAVVAPALIVVTAGNQSVRRHLQACGMVERNPFEWVADYKLLERLGSGGFADTFRAEKDGEFYAIKVLRELPSRQRRGAL